MVLFWSSLVDVAHEGTHDEVVPALPISWLKAETMSEPTFELLEGEGVVVVVVVVVPVVVVPAAVPAAVPAGVGEAELVPAGVGDAVSVPAKVTVGSSGLGCTTTEEEEEEYNPPLVEHISLHSLGSGPLIIERLVAS